MYSVRNVSEDLFWIGADDRRLALFENIFPIPRGVSYNAYVLMDEKTALLDTADYSVGRQFRENLDHVLGGRSLDYVIVNHMEPDHCALLADIARDYPDAVFVGNAKTFQMISQFYQLDLTGRNLVVKEGDTLTLGKHTLTFVMAPMVHWPEAMMTYDVTDKTLFAADAFGSFGALNGNLFADDVNFDRDWLDDARRYYTNIVGKYGTQVQAVLKKASGIEISTICPLHGPIWRENLGYILDKYMKWSTYTPEDKNVMIVYASMYGDTESAACALANLLAERGLKHIAVYDVSNTHVSALIAEAFRCSHIVLAAPTYNAGIYPVMENFLTDMKALNLQGRTVAIMDNGTWAASAGKQMAAKLEEMKNMTILPTTLSIRSALHGDRAGELEAFADMIMESMK